MESKAQRDGEEKYEYEEGSSLTLRLPFYNFFAASICAAIKHRCVTAYTAPSDWPIGHLSYLSPY
jgi:hypothetical protein